MVTITDRSQMPEQAKTGLDLLERFGFKAKFVSDYPTPELTKRLQIRDEKHYAPRAEVDKIANVMRLGEKVPPSIMSSDGYTVDGNTRNGAAIKNKYPHIEALVLTEKWDRAPEDVRRRMRALGAAANLRNGKGIDRNETRQAIENLHDDPNLDSTKVAALLGVTETTVRGIVAEKKARDRAQQLGIDLGERMSSVQLKRLGTQSDMNDAPWGELAKLTRDAGLSASEISTIIKAVKEQKSDEGAMKFLATEFDVRQRQIAEHKMSGRKQPSPHAKLRQSIGFVLKQRENLDDLIERNPANQPKALELFSEAKSVFETLYDRQKAIIGGASL